MDDSPISLRQRILRHRRAVVATAHGALFVIAFAGAFFLRFDFSLNMKPDNVVTIAKGMRTLADRIEKPDAEGELARQNVAQNIRDYAQRLDAPRSWLMFYFLPALLPLLAIKMSVFGLFRLYEGWWRYVGFADLLAVFKGAYVSTLIFFMVIYGQWVMFDRLGQSPLVSSLLPRSIYLLDFGLTVALVGGARLLFRLWDEQMRPISSRGVSRMLIIGAGNAGMGMLREISRMPVERYRVVGFVDDDPTKQGARIMGSPVIGSTAEIRSICAKEKVDEILIAIPSATRKQLQRIVNEVQGINIKFRTVPAISDLIDGKVSVSQIKEVDINDLLGRDPITLDCEGIGRFLRGRSVLITGAGGSIGSELCRQVGAFEPAALVLVEQAENNLFFVERELRDKFPQLAIRAYICDITDRTRTDRIFAAEKPAVVFHAAAHKHVPLMEANPGEAIKNNVLGTRSVADAAARWNAEKFVMISTDKAVNPTSVMGCSKRVAEIYIQNLGRRTRTQFVTVRFGNVLGSAGSVVPIFKAQIAAGGPVTVTDERMVRYFMTIPEASQLVLQAGSMGRGGEIFVLDMGEPVKIIDMARTMITLSGFRPDEDIEIRVTGRRPGEKLFEELSIAGENMAATSHPKILTWQNVPYDDQQVADAVATLSRLIDPARNSEVIEALKRIVPEYTPAGDSVAGVKVAQPPPDKVEPAPSPAA